MAIDKMIKKNTSPPLDLSRGESEHLGGVIGALTTPERRRKGWQLNLYDMLISLYVYDDCGYHFGHEVDEDAALVMMLGLNLRVETTAAELPPQKSLDLNRNPHQTSETS
ncbi:hypothetical protein ACLOJK_030904 [Asimina triloba]